MSEKEDLPKSIVVILVVLAVAISVLGTFTVLYELNKLDKAPVSKGNPVQTAEVTLTVENPNGGLNSATGEVTFEIMEV